MTILSPTTNDLHRKLLAIQEELKQEPPVDELEQFLATKKGRRSKKAADAEKAVHGIELFVTPVNITWLAMGTLPFIPLSGLDASGLGTEWIAGMIGAPLFTQAALMFGASRTEKISLGYREAVRSKTKRRKELEQRINEARSEMLSSAAEDLRQQRFTITGSDPINHSFTTHQGVISLMTDSDHRMVVTLNGAPIRASYATQAMFDGVELIDAAGSPVATRAPLVVGAPAGAF